MLSYKSLNRKELLMITDEEYEDSGEEELSFSELLASATLNGEIVITIPKEEVIRVKTGLKNAKAKQANKFKEEGLIPDPSTFTFYEKDSEDVEGYTDLTIILSRKSTVKVAKITIPSDDF